MEVHTALRDSDSSTFFSYLPWRQIFVLSGVDGIFGNSQKSFTANERA